MQNPTTPIIGQADISVHVPGASLGGLPPQVLDTLARCERMMNEQSLLISDTDSMNCYHFHLQGPKEYLAVLEAIRDNKDIDKPIKALQRRLGMES